MTGGKWGPQNKDGSYRNANWTMTGPYGVNGTENRDMGGTTAQPSMAPPPQGRVGKTKPMPGQPNRPGVPGGQMPGQPGQGRMGKQVGRNGVPTPRMPQPYPGQPGGGPIMNVGMQQNPQRTPMPSQMSAQQQAYADQQQGLQAQMQQAQQANAAQKALQPEQMQQMAQVLRGPGG